MIYEAFLETITNRLQTALGEAYQFTLRPLPKNNGVTLDGLTIQKNGSTLAPTVYLNPYYEQHLRGITIDEILSDILKLYHSTPTPCRITEDDMKQFDFLKSKVMFRVIHTASNRILLSDIPSIQYLDLSIVFFLALERNEDGQMTALIHNDHIRRWGITAQELWKLARKNTPREYPAEIRSMVNMMKEVARRNLGADFDDSYIEQLLLGKDGEAPLYVLSNSNALYGASCLLYYNTLKDFADSLGKDLVILPSSIHEVLLVPNHPETSYEELSAMVTTINHQEVPPEDQLSNQVYLYTRADDRLTIMSHAPDAVGRVTAGSQSDIPAQLPATLLQSETPPDRQ